MSFLQWYGLDKFESRPGLDVIVMEMVRILCKQKRSVWFQASFGLMPYRRFLELLELWKPTQWRGFVLNYWRNVFIPERDADFHRSGVNSNSGAQTFFNEWVQERLGTSILELACFWCRD